MANISFSNISNASNVSKLSPNESSEIGGMDFFLANIAECLPYVILLSLGTIIGVLGNLIVMLTIIVNRELHSSTYILMFNLALADIMVNLFTNTGGIYTLFYGETYSLNRPVLCNAIAFICFLGTNVSLSNLGFIALNRYINICHNNLYKKLFTNKLTIFYCVLIWIYGLLNNLPNLTGWNNYTFDKKAIMCLWNRQNALSYNWYLFIVCVNIPCMGIFFCYSRIYFYAKKSNNTSKSSNLGRSIRLAKTLFASFLLYTFCWMPFGLAVMFDFDNKVPRIILLYSTALGLLNSSLNPIIYSVFNSSFRSACLNLFHKICCCTSFLNLRITRVSASGNQISSNTANSLQNRALYNN